MISSRYLRRIRKSLWQWVFPLDCCRFTFLSLALDVLSPTAGRLPPRLRRLLGRNPGNPTLPGGSGLEASGGDILVKAIDIYSVRRQIMARIAPDAPNPLPPHCQRAALAGLFLRCGYMQDPRNGYHLEIAVKERWRARLTRRIGRLLRLPFKVMRRRNRIVYYLKDRRHLLRLLKRLELHDLVMELQDLVSTRDLMGLVNRQVNFETANINKSVAAADLQTERIRRLLAHHDKGIWSPALKELALLRLKHPHDGYEALGSRCTPPLSKSAVNHRLRRIMDLYQKTFPESPSKLEN